MSKRIFKIFLLLVFILFNINLFSQNAHWASRVESFSSERDTPYFGKVGKALHILGKPSLFPKMDSTGSAWQTFQPDSQEEYIIVSFDTLMAIRQIAVFENFNAGTLSEVYGLDFNNGLHLIKKMPLGYNNYKSQVTNIILDELTSYELKAVKLVFSPKRVQGFSQIDAVGISQTSVPIQEELSLPKDQNAVYYRERLSNDINSIYNEICPIVSPDGKTLYYTRWRHPKNFGDNKNQDIWFSNLSLEGEWSKPEIMPEPINNAYDNALCAISSDGKTILLSNVYNKDGTMSKGVSRSFKLRTGIWGTPQEVKIEGYENRDEYSEFALSPDGKIIVFAAEMSDSYGGKDLYVTFEKDDNTWSKPINLGPTVNTGESESTPFIAPDGVTLYFSSKGHIGYGNNDIFLTRRLSSNWEVWSEPENLGPIINTPFWDGYFSVSAKGDYAYFSSDMNSIGFEDIFRLKLPEKIKPVTLVYFKADIIDDSTNQKIKADVIFRTVDGSDSTHYEYDPYLGNISFMYSVKKPFELIITKNGYLMERKYFNYTNLREYSEVYEQIKLKELTVNKKFQLPDINFEQSKSELMPDAFDDLDQVVKILNQNKEFSLLIEGHTDNQGDWYQNMRLSDERVKSVANYLINKGIEASRIQTKGWGSNKPLRNNTTEAQRRLNRRVEFTLISPFNNE